MKIHSHHIRSAHGSDKLESLHELFQKAMEIEHATIPVYLSALYSLKPGTNPEIHSVLESVTIEEMLHMTIVANIMNALGGSPSLIHEDFVPKYPESLPMGIGDDLHIGCYSYSPWLVHEMFMKIEMPDHPLDLEDEEAIGLRLENEEHHTIGLLYRLLQRKIRNLPYHELPGNPDLQLSGFGFSEKELFPVLTKHDAIRAINVIIDQGEGSSHSPIDKFKEPAHYYRFAELFHGHEIAANTAMDCGFSYTGREIPFDSTQVHQLYPNTKLEMFEQDSYEQKLSLNFKNKYHELLHELNKTFNGQKENMETAIGKMIELKIAANKLCETPFPGKPGFYIGPIFV